MERFAEFWEPASGARLLRRVVSEARVLLRLPVSPGAREAKGVRQLVPRFAELNARDALLRLRNVRELDLGVLDGKETERLELRAAELGLDLTVEDRCRVEHLPLAPGASEPTAFCDPGVEELVILFMLAAGVDLLHEEA